MVEKFDGTPSYEEDAPDSAATSEALGSSAVGAGDQALDGAGKINLDRLQAAFPALTVEQAMKYISWAPKDEDLGRLELSRLDLFPEGAEQNYGDVLKRGQLNNHKQKIEYALEHATEEPRRLRSGPVLSYVDSSMSLREAIRVADSRIVKWWLEAESDEIEQNPDYESRAKHAIWAQMSVDSYLAEADGILPEAGTDLEHVPEIDVEQFQRWWAKERADRANPAQPVDHSQALSPGQAAVARNEAVGACGYERVFEWVSLVSDTFSEAILPPDPEVIIQQLSDHGLLDAGEDALNLDGNAPPKQMALTAARLLANQLTADNTGPQGHADNVPTAGSFITGSEYATSARRRVFYQGEADKLTFQLAGQPTDQPYGGLSHRSTYLSQGFYPVRAIFEEFSNYAEAGHVTTGAGNVVFAVDMKAFRQALDSSPPRRGRYDRQDFSSVWLGQYDKHLMQIFEHNPDGLSAAEQDLAQRVTEAQSDRIAQLGSFEQMASDTQADAVVYAFAELSVKVMGMSPAFRFNEEYKQRIKTVLAERGLDVDDLAERSKAIEEAKKAESSRLEADPHAGSTRSAAGSRIPPPTQVSTGSGRLKAVTSWFRRNGGAEDNDLSPEGQQMPEIQPPQELNGLEQQLLTIWQEYTNCTTDSSYDAQLIMKSIAPGEATVAGPDAV